VRREAALRIHGDPVLPHRLLQAQLRHVPRDLRERVRLPHASRADGALDAGLRGRDRRQGEGRVRGALLVLPQQADSGPHVVATGLHLGEVGAARAARDAGRQDLDQQLRELGGRGARLLRDRRQPADGGAADRRARQGDRLRQHAGAAPARQHAAREGPRECAPLRGRGDATGEQGDRQSRRADARGDPVPRGGALRVEKTPARIEVLGRGIQEIHGRPSAPHPRKLLYLHSAMGEASWLTPHLNELAERVELFAPTHPGFVGSEGIDEIRDVEDLVYHYLAYLHAKGSNSVAVMGVSLGGWIAAELAARYPERVSRLVLVSSVGVWLPEKPVASLFPSAGQPPEKLRELLFH